MPSGIVTFKGTDAEPERLLERLTAGERARHDAFPAAKRRADWLLGRVAGKAAVRALLAAEGAAAPPWQELELTSDASGAPRVWLAGAPADLAVSLTHGHGRAAAWATRPGSRGSLPGVDLEQVRPRRLGTLRFYLHPDERAWVLALPGGTEDPDPDGPSTPRDLAAIVCWALKEAAFKALMPPRGTGLLDVGVTLDTPFDALEGAARVRYLGAAADRAVALGVGEVRAGWERADDLVLAWVEAVGGALPPLA